MVMEVPFLSSSAINREHYNLVQSVESATTPQQVDDVLVHEIDVVRRRLGRRHPSSSECVESLILLLYCWTATTLGHVTRAALEFALPHAVTLAETGSTMKQKRTGYMFCMEIMRSDDALQIMLVNTLRKDLEDPDIARICLALDVLVLNCPPDAIPAVTPRLIDLLAHDSPNIKRKSIGVIRQIGLQEPDILSSTKEKIALRLRDPETCAVSAALGILGSLTQSRVITPSTGLDMALQAFSDSEAHKSQTQSLRIKFAEVFGILVAGIHADDPDPAISYPVVQTLCQMIRNAADTEHALVIECFRALARCPAQVLRQEFASSGQKTFSILDRHLGSRKPNVQYLCIASLLALDASLWAGTTEIPAAFDEGQVNIIMGHLDSPDSIIRKKTLQLLHRVDPQILAMHLSQLLSTFHSYTIRDRHRIAERVLEASAVHDEDGEAYADRLKDITIGLKVNDKHISKGKGKAVDSGAGLVSENVVEQVLLHLRSSSEGFCRAFIDTTARIPVSDAGPTLTLVIAASLCEYGSLSSIPQEDLLRGLAARLNANPPAIQEALLLTMLRVTARCESSLPDVSDQVRALHEVSRSHIRNRCEQYISLSEQMASLKRVAASAKSDTLPDFLLALENMRVDSGTPPQTRYRSPTASEDTPKSRSPAAASKLRYEAYDPPRPAPKLTRRPSSASSVHSHATSPRSDRSDSISSSYSHSPLARTGRERGIDAVTDGDPDDGLSRTLTAGDLALAVHEPDFARSSSISKVQPQAESRRHIVPRSQPIEDLKNDLIALDSPFLAEPSQSSSEDPQEQTTVDFQTTWDALKDNTVSRGWCERGPEEVKQRLEAMTQSHVIAIPPDIQPYQGETKVVVSGLYTGLLAAIRLRPGEEGSTLWQLRCLDASMKAELKRIVEDG